MSMFENLIQLFECFSDFLVLDIEWRKQPQNFGPGSGRYHARLDQIYL